MCLYDRYTIPTYCLMSLVSKYVSLCVCVCPTCSEFPSVLQLCIGMCQMEYRFSWSELVVLPHTIDGYKNKGPKSLQ